jgi:hypothetical protein
MARNSTSKLNEIVRRATRLARLLIRRQLLQSLLFFLCKLTVSKREYQLPLPLGYRRNEDAKVVADQVT